MFKQYFLIGFNLNPESEQLSRDLGYPVEYIKRIRFGHPNIKRRLELLCDITEFFKQELGPDTEFYDTHEGNDFDYVLILYRKLMPIG